MIDNYDSFTYNIVQYSQELGADIKVIRNDELNVKEIERLNPQKLIISPGPATPDEAGICLDAIEYFKDKMPILGICLGHQSIGQVFGAKVVRAKNLMHGKTSIIHKELENAILNNIPKEFRATRYHSLVLEKDTLPNNIKITAKSIDDDEIMAIAVDGYQVFGVQFHPESIMSEFGYEILDNFLKL